MGKDADSIFKTRAELSDKEMEQWSREDLHGYERFHTSVIKQEYMILLLIMHLPYRL